MSHNKGKRREKKVTDVFITIMKPVENYTGEVEYPVYAGMSERTAVFNGEQEEQVKQGTHFFEVSRYDGKRFHLEHTSEKTHINVMDEEN